MRLQHIKILYKGDTLNGFYSLNKFIEEKQIITK